MSTQEDKLKQTSLHLSSYYNGNISDISPCADMLNLETFIMDRTDVTDLSPLSDLILKEIKSRKNNNNFKRRRLENE